jgi:hypothetical protein
MYIEMNLHLNIYIPRRSNERNVELFPFFFLFMQPYNTGCSALGRRIGISPGLDGGKWASGFLKIMLH